MTILVTGGAGFIGSHLCERLLEQGNDVICLDNLSTGRWQNIFHLKKYEDFEFGEWDIRFNVLLNGNIDQIYNLACPASPIQYQKDPIETIKTSVIGSINMLENAKMKRAKILQASTSEVYGDPSEHPQKETYWGNVNPIGPRSCYDEGKRCAESLFINYHHQYGVKVKIARIFNTYGPRMRPDDGRVVSNFITKAIEGKDLIVHGIGSQTRSLCYVDDTVEGLIRLMNTPDEITGPVNIGNDNEISIYELAEKIVSMTDAKSDIVLVPIPADDPKRRRPDLAMAKTLLKWQPKISLEKGLKRTIEYYLSCSERAGRKEKIAVG